MSVLTFKDTCISHKDQNYLKTWTHTKYVAEN